MPMVNPLEGPTKKGLNTPRVRHCAYITNNARNIIKKKILKCLTEDFKRNQALYDKKEGYACCNGIDLEMIMDKVVKGIEMAKHEINDAAS